MKIIVIANRKGGVGKSTCTAHLALEAIAQNNKVILIDLDPQKTLTKWWEKREEVNPFLTESDITDLQTKINVIEKNNFDFVFIDTPGDISHRPDEAIKLSDLVIIPCKPTSTDLESIGRTINIVKKEKKSFIFVLCQSIPKANATLEAASVLSEFGPIAPNSIVNRISYVNAMHQGISAVQINANAKNELSKIWNFIKNKLNSNTNYGKEKKKFLE